MHYVKRYVGYLVALVLIVAAAVGVSSLQIRIMPPEHTQMDPTKKVQDWLVVHRRDRNALDLEHGQVVRYVLRHSKYDESEEIFISRILALEGERIAIRDGLVYVARPGSKINYDKDLVSEAYMDKDSADKTLQFPEILVPRGHVFVLNDNRRSVIGAKKLSLYHGDSRFFGPISAKLILGTINTD